MELYHGTSVTSAQQIMKSGFAKTKTNWKDFPPLPGMVYLSDIYALYYARPKNGRFKDKAALIKVEVDERFLYPDEDYIGFALGLNKESPQHQWRKAKRLAKSRPDWWKLSYKDFGTVCVPVDKITVIGVRYFEAVRLGYIYDPSVSLICTKVMGDYYRHLHNEIYNGVTIDELIAKKQEELKRLLPDSVDKEKVNFIQT